jgi:hypothetical protein
MEKPEAKPSLQRVFEDACLSMRLDKGRHRLELVFMDGHLERFWVHAESRPARELHRYDDEANVGTVS